MCCYVYLDNHCHITHEHVKGNNNKTYPRTCLCLNVRSHMDDRVILDVRVAWVGAGLYLVYSLWATDTTHQQLIIIRIIIIMSIFLELLSM